MPAPLLVIWHSRTGASEALARAAATAAGPQAQLLRADQVEEVSMLAAGGYLFCCPENLAALPGTMKEMFDRLYYPLLGRIEGRAYASIIAAGSDGRGAQAQLDRIVTGWRLRRVAEPVIVNLGAQTPEEIVVPKTITARDIVRAKELGAGMGEGLAAGIF